MRIFASKSLKPRGIIKFQPTAWELKIPFVSFPKLKLFVSSFLVKEENMFYNFFSRVDRNTEKRGLDIRKHNEPAYPSAAYGHGWETDDPRAMGYSA